MCLMVGARVPIKRPEVTMNKPQMWIHWNDGESKPISREKAAREIRRNRRQPRALVRVFRKHRETYIVSELFGVGCCIHRS